MNAISPKKLLHSKWTRVQARNKEKHFTVITVKFDHDMKVELCEIQAIFTNRIQQINWRELKNSHQWQQGWR